MYGISEMEEHDFYVAVIMAANRCEVGKDDDALAVLLRLRDDANRLIAKHEAAVNRYYDLTQPT